jgi:hypothetical protein
MDSKTPNFPVTGLNSFLRDLAKGLTYESIGSLYYVSLPPTREGSNPRKSCWLYHDCILMTTLTHLNTGHAQRCLTFMTQFWTLKKLRPFNISPNAYVLHLSTLHLVLYIRKKCMSLRTESEDSFILRGICYSRTFYFVSQKGWNSIQVRLFHLVNTPCVVFVAIIAQELELIL